MESIEPVGPAQAAGLKVGDLVVTFDGLAVNGIDDLQRALTGERIGKAFEAVVLRRGRLRVVELKPREMPG